VKYEMGLNMGLTISYKLNFSGNNSRELVENIRQLALDLPFEDVGEIVEMQGDECNVEARRNELYGESLFWLMIQASRYIQFPWNSGISICIDPVHLIAFSIFPGGGCEAANFGLCLYPDVIQATYMVEDDKRFQTNYEFDRFKLGNRKLRRKSGDKIDIRTRLGGWSWRSFCKTQYASDPAYGGVVNFLRCHISVIALLDRIRLLGGCGVRVRDEGEYGGCGGKYNPDELVKQVVSYNELVASVAGTLKDSCYGELISSPILGFSNFEQLEFRGCHKHKVSAFLELLKKTHEEVGNDDTVN
jgi:hypothetical protein